MAYANRGGVRIHWRLEGAAGKPAIVLLNSIATTLHLCDRLAPLLLDDFRLLRVDTRGHGGSDAPSGDYSLDLLADDVLAAMDAAGIDSAILCGVSLGGMISMTLALKAPERVNGLLLACTSAAFDAQFWTDRIAAVRAYGVASIADASIARFFSDRFALENPELVAAFRGDIIAMSSDGYAGCGAAIRDMHLLDRLGAVRAPTVVAAGAFDNATPYQGHGDRIVAAIPGARAVLLQTGHLSCVEDPHGFERALRDLAARCPPH